MDEYKYSGEDRVIWGSGSNAVNSVIRNYSEDTINLSTPLFRQRTLKCYISSRETLFIERVYVTCLGFSPSRRLS